MTYSKEKWIATGDPRSGDEVYDDEGLEVEEGRAAMIERAIQHVNTNNPFVAKSAEIVMRKHWLAEYMVDFAWEENALLVAEVERLTAERDKYKAAIMLLADTLPPKQGGTLCREAIDVGQGERMSSEQQNTEIQPTKPLPNGKLTVCYDRDDIAAIVTDHICDQYGLSGISATTEWHINVGQQDRKSISVIFTLKQ